MTELVGGARPARSRILRVGFVCALMALPWCSPQPAGAHGSPRSAVSPLPASDYTVRPVCAAPAPGYASCLALELVPETAAARAHTHPLGITLTSAIGAGEASEACRPPLAAEGCWGLRPQDLHSAYGLPTTSASAQTQTIALVDAYDDPAVEGDLNVYDEEFGLPACTRANGCFTKVNQRGERRPLPVANGDAEVEISLDVEVAHAVCQNCHILLVEAESLSYDDLEAAENRAVTLGATEISNSWYGSEPTADSAAYEHPGIVITAASGDYGYLNWDLREAGGPEEPEEIEQGFVNYPASSPHVVAVGGTRLELNSPSSTWEKESVWNGYGAGGSGCSERFAAAPWQQELPDWESVGCGSKRAVADVAADADPYTGVAIYDYGWRTVGGTSLASPIIAATFALAGGAGGVEYPAKTLYENEIMTQASLHDVESGSNGECNKRVTSEGLSGCTALEEAASCSDELICLAGSGYDGPSGVGTPDGIGAFEPTGEPGKSSQTIEFTSSAPERATIGGATYALGATASSGLATYFTSRTPFVCSVAGSTVSFIAVGTCTIDADQAGDDAYKAAPQAQQSFAVRKGSQVITFTSTAPANAAVGGAAYLVAATASSGLPVAFLSETSSVCSVEGSTVSFIAVGTCAIDAYQQGDSDYKAAPQAQQSFAVVKKAQLIAFTSNAPETATVGGSAYTVAASATSGLEVSFSSATPEVCSLEGPTVSFIGAGTCTIDASQAGNSEYEAAPAASQSFTVDPAPTPPSTSQPAASSTLSFTSSLIPALTPAPDSEFSLLGAPAVNRRTGAVTFTSSVADPGIFSWLLTFRNGAFGAFQASRTRCGAGQVRLDGKCRPTHIVFGKGERVVTAAGLASFTVKPSAAAERALQSALEKGRGLSVTATLTFQSSLGGSPVSHARAINDRLARSDEKGRR
jgi:hypothetical protein